MLCLIQYVVLIWNIFCFQITTAVKFLQNPKVRESPLATRKAFLKKKGELEFASQAWGKKHTRITWIPTLIHGPVDRLRSVAVTQAVSFWEGNIGLCGSRVVTVALCPRGGLTGVDLASECMIQAWWINDTPVGDAPLGSGKLILTNTLCIFNGIINIAFQRFNPFYLI